MTVLNTSLKIAFSVFFFTAATLFAVGEGAFADGGNHRNNWDDDHDRRNKQCHIDDVIVDGTLIIINGHHLKKRRSFPTVTIGGQAALVDEDYSTKNHIEATIQENLERGSYRVELAYGARKSNDNCDPFEVSVGGQTPSYPLTIATDQAFSSEASATRILINGAKISGDVAPGSLVPIRFNYNMSYRGAIYIGFDGHPWVCIFPAEGKLGGFVQRSSTAPTTPGAHRLSILWREDSNCPVTVGNMPANPLHGSTLGVVVVR